MHSGGGPREGAGRRVLVIDDEEPILNLLREHLVKCGYEVKVAVRGEAGLNELKQNPFDVTFCDWKMPGLNGRQVYETLRHTNPRLCRRMIFITGDVINEPMRQFLETEKLPCLTKPFALPELRAAIQTVLETK
ncbi:MAG: response regulator [Acidobacteriia bacterium]|nr:response regulator [Terriglobia bacterium]